MLHRSMFQIFFTWHFVILFCVVEHTQKPNTSLRTTAQVTLYAASLLRSVLEYSAKHWIYTLITAVYMKGSCKQDWTKRHRAKAACLTKRKKTHMVWGRPLSQPPFFEICVPFWSCIPFHSPLLSPGTHQQGRQTSCQTGSMEALAPLFTHEKWICSKTFLDVLRGPGCLYGFLKPTFLKACLPSWAVINAYVPCHLPEMCARLTT